MYSESEDFRTVWGLAHEWAGYHPEKSEHGKLSDQVKLNLQRLASAILSRSIRAQTKRAAIITDESILTYLFEAKHFYKLLNCKWGKSYDKNYLEMLRYHSPIY